VRKRTLWLGALIAAAVTAVIAMLLIPPADRDDPDVKVIEPDLELEGDLPVLAEPTAFELRDHTGTRFDRASLNGQVTIAGFVFTRCQTVCPLITLRMRKLQEQTRGTPVKLVSFSVDPQHDTPEVLAAYAAKAGADPARWRFVTGDPTEVRRVVAGMLRMSMDPDGTLQPNGVPNVVHTEHLALIDKSGRVRGYYDSSDDERLARLHDDLTALLAE